MGIYIGTFHIRQTAAVCGCLHISQNLSPFILVPWRWKKFSSMKVKKV